MIRSELTAHKTKLLERREGVPHAVRQLLRRSRGLDLLDPGEDLRTEETMRFIPMQDGSSMPITFRVIKDLFFPVPSLLSYRRDN